MQRRQAKCVGRSGLPSSIFAVVYGAIAIAAASTAPAAEPTGQVSDWIGGYNSRLRLLAGHDMSAPGRPLTAGVEIETKPDWKTYWRNPGDSGVPPSFDWSKSENVASVAVAYPAPRRLVDKGGTTIGYLGRVIFPAVITPLDPAKPVSLKLSIEYGVCKDICVPAQAEAGLELPPGGAAAMPPPLAAAVAALPRLRGRERPGDPVVKNLSVSLGAAPRIVIEAEVPGGGEAADAFFVAEDGGFIPLPEREILAAGDSNRPLVRFVVNLGKDVDLAALADKTVHATIAGAEGATDVVIPIGRK